MGIRLDTALRGGNAQLRSGGGLFFQINNSFYAEQVIDQSKTVNINNSAPNSTITAVLISSMSNTGLALG